jgi:hypothetical protein
LEKSLRCAPGCGKKKGEAAPKALAGAGAAKKIYEEIKA